MKGKEETRRDLGCGGDEDLRGVGGETGLEAWWRRYREEKEGDGSGTR